MDNNEYLTNEFLAQSDDDDSWLRDSRLTDFEDEVDLIFNSKIKMLVQYLLTRSDEFWTAPVSNDELGHYSPDEYADGGLVIHTKRTVLAFMMIKQCMGFTTEEIDCALASLMIRNLTKVVTAGTGKKKALVFDPFHLYTIDSFIERNLESSQNEGEDLEPIIGLEEVQLNMILHLVHTSDGFASIIPETYPQSNLEKCVHLAVMMAACAHVILDLTSIEAGNDSDE